MVIYLIKHKKWYTFYSPKICKMFKQCRKEAEHFTAIGGVSHKSSMQIAFMIRHYQINSFRYRNPTVPVYIIYPNCLTNQLKLSWVVEFVYSIPNIYNIHIITGFTTLALSLNGRLPTDRTTWCACADLDINGYHSNIKFGFLWFINIPFRVKHSSHWSQSYLTTSCL